jgi:hypothetical protein
MEDCRGRDMINRGLRPGVACSVRSTGTHTRCDGHPMVRYSWEGTSEDEAGERRGMAGLAWLGHLVGQVSMRVGMSSGLR